MDTQAPRTRSRALVVTLIASIAFIIGAGALALHHRFDFIHVNQAVVARCDRLTGKVIFVSIYGKEVGSYPRGFDPFADDQATPGK